MFKNITFVFYTVVETATSKLSASYFNLSKKFYI